MEGEKLKTKHDEAVARIQKQVKHFYDTKQYFRIYHGSTSSTRPLNFTRDAIVDVSDMTHVFPVDPAAKTVQVEPKVPMDALVAHTLKYGFVPEVVMELKGITTGGGFSGMSGESSSFKYGMFHSSCAEIEIVLGDGTVTTASLTHQADLFQGTGGSMGTMGIVTLLTVKLIEARSHVDLEIKHMSDPQSIPKAFEEAIEGGNVDFIDAIYFEKDMAALMLGRLTDTPSARVLEKMQVHWFADEVHQAVKKNKGTSKISLKLVDYLFRFDHGAFWGGKLAFQHFHVPNNRITRKLADPLLDSRTCYQALHKSGLANEYLVQDFGIPASNAAAFISWVTQTLPHLQLFMCPGKTLEGTMLKDLASPHLLSKAQERLIGIGVYGRGPANTAEFVEMNRKLEHKAFELYGTKLLYARVYLDETEFWSTYNKPNYDALRKKYKADTLPNVYDKIAADMSKIPKRRPIRGIVGTVLDKVRGNTEYILTSKKANAIPARKAE